MTRFAFAVLVILSTAVSAQVPAPTAPAPRPTAEELAFARLPADIQQMLAGQTPAQAMRNVQYAEQNLIALGLPNPTPEQLRSTLKAVLSGSSYDSSSYSSSVGSASAGATSFPPLSPLVTPPPLTR